MKPLVVALAAVMFAAVVGAAPALRPKPPKPPDESKVAVGLELYSWGGTRLRVEQIDPDGTCHFREVLSGVSTLDGEAMGYPPKPRREVADMLRRACQRPDADGRQCLACPACRGKDRPR